GLPLQHLFTHHEEPRTRNLVSEYDDKYNRHGYNPLLPPLRHWNGHRLAWVPQKNDFPILEPPTNYGLLEYLMKKWHGEEDEVMKSVYTISYGNPLASALAPCQQRQPAKAYDLLYCQGHLPQNVSPILDYEGARSHLEAIRQLVRDRQAGRPSL
ncbi:PREDICTED: uncharacterized protein C1orf158 homolog, partial [Merops nubicus]|uniref:uncharacterized protein C1orf158 homolog n=1 Tax=Merops nubicus TaxID=57421 RepID=UPI0004F09B41